jgi:twitching motility protein PilI
MAKREANQELQKRLEERLRTARTEGIAASWLAVESGGRKFLFPLTHSGEIFNATAPHAVPYTKPWFLGVVNLRGGVFGVIDFAALVLGMPTRLRADSGRDGARLIALNSLFDVNCVLLVDRLAGLRGVDGFAGSAAPAAADPPYFGHCYTDLNGIPWQEINLQQFAQQPDFLAIGA